MSTFIDDETLQEYINESLEHLGDIEQDLLTIEENGADIDEEVVNRVFRAAHSLKGGAGFLALETIKELAHKIENVLDMVRNREIIPNPENINILLNSFDKLRDLINNSDTSNEENIDEFVSALIGLTTAHLAPTEQQSISNLVPIIRSDDSVVFEVPEIDLSQAKKSAQNLFLLEYDLIHDVYQHGKTPMDVIKNVMDLGTIIESLIDIERVGTLDDTPINSIPFYMLISSIIEPVVAPGFLEVPDEKIWFIGYDGREITAPAPASQAAPSSAAEVVAEPASEAKVIESQPAPAPKASPPKTTPKIAPAEKPAPVPDSNTSKSPAAGGGDEGRAGKSGPEAHATLRVNVSLLESLMTLAGEMVLSRNQLMQAITQQDPHSIKLAGQRIDLVTSELQEAIMMTRMQPIGSVFNKFPRVVRDMAQKLGKEINLIINGKEVELDKTIVEGLSDPLTHLIRNSADHGIELPDQRQAAGKARAGRIELKAYHDAGQVNIEITDDGNGLDADKIADKALEKGMISSEQHKTMSRKEKMALILLPSLSTAEKITDVSGRGVGMDVVKSNIDQLGGQIDLDSEPGRGTTVKIKLPLTLAIIPSLLVSVGHERFAVPQVNVSELVRIGAAEVKEKIERVGDSEVMPLRGELIPLIRLSSVLGITVNYQDPESGESLPDRRQQIADRRSPSSPIEGEAGTNEPELAEQRDGSDRRYKAASDLNIVVVSAGSFKYGLVVDDLHDSVEIVVKPLDRHLKHIPGYAGATIMGDGRVALILDVGGIAKQASLTSMAGSRRARELAASDEHQAKDRQALLLFRNGPEEPCAVPLDIVERVEQVNFNDIETKNNQRVMKYRGGSLPLFSLSDVSKVSEIQADQELVVIVFTVAEREIGLLASEPVDTVEISAVIDHDTLRSTGIMGSAIIKEQTTMILDIYELVETLKPDWFRRLQKKEERLKEQQFAARADTQAPSSAPAIKKILLVEDSDFFRSQLKRYIDDEERQCIPAEDGLIAWNWLQENPDVPSLIITDIEMPNMDGFELSRRIKNDSRFDHLKIIAVTSLAADEHIARGREVGIDDYQIKLDKDKLLASIDEHIS